MKRLTVLILIFLSLVLPERALAEITLPGLMSDGMVLQRETYARIWGKADPGKKLSLVTSWDNVSYRVTPDDEGNWQVSVRTGAAGGPYTISLSQGRQKREIRDVLVGEVWLCSGQSNMQMPLMGFRSQPVIGSFEALLDAPSRGDVRLFHVPKIIRAGLQEDVNAHWERCGVEAASTFSAIGYFFATRLASSLGIPVGMIESDCGATRIEPWMSLDAARTVDPDISLSSPDDINAGAGVLFNSMIWPLRNYALRGFLWYQGESNNCCHKSYHKFMSALADNWRATFGGGVGMPFYYVMLAPFVYTDNTGIVPDDIIAPLMWESQVKALELIPNSDIAVTTDIGDPDFIHPSQKKTVADRLVLLALHGTYGQVGGTDEGNALSWRGPLYKGVEFADGKAVVEFDNAGTLCPAKPFETVPVEGFEIAGRDRVFHKAFAHIVQPVPYAFTNRVEVYSPEVPEPVAVRYAFHNIPSGNLTSSVFLPAFPFRTDDWDDVR